MGKAKIRKKLEGETLIFDLAKEGLKAANRKIRRVVKIKSATKELIL